MLVRSVRRAVVSTGRNLVRGVPLERRIVGTRSRFDMESFGAEF